MRKTTKICNQPGGSKVRMLEISSERMMLGAVLVITSDPNRMDDEEYIVRLIGQVITVSLETLKVVNALPAVTEQKD